AERRRVPHHLIDVLEPWESASVAWWLERAAQCCQEIEGRGKRVLFVGGTPLYLKALLRGLFRGAPADLEMRRRLTAEAEQLGPHAWHARLAEVDPVTAARLHPRNVRRIVRALEVWQLTGKRMSEWQTQWSRESGAMPAVFCLDVPRSELYARIDRRVVEMIEAGWVEEARKLRALPHPLSREAAQAVGYKEIFAYLDGAATLPETISRIQQRTRNFAKRQLTWFRHMPECRFVTEELTSGLGGLRIE